ncbi:protein ACCELERATED CELL DEATH 6-like [Macadamia integrifolia]|uniref:protein ACCELERATED CELL DEATH 6-like n=1 Tax=Macadamia integrifolia TaxID=60698 RepID=UPI001C4EF038|nr:protein ACCELERATED CELL DEATH 6-like [Macadamia integrifolia]
MSERACDKTMDPKLYEAARKGDTNLLRQIPDLDQQAMRLTLNTALHIAVRYGQYNFVQELSSKYPSLLTQANSEGDTPLHIAAWTGNEVIARLLISKLSADIESAGVAEKLRLRNKYEYMPLHEAIRNHNLEVAKLLIEADPGWSCYDNDADESLIYLAARTGNKDMVKLIVEQPAAYGGPKGEKALYVAAARKDFEIVEALSEKKIELIKGADENGKTPLHYAAEYGNYKIVEKLISKYPCSAITLDENGQSPLHIAASKSYRKVVAELIKHCPECMEQLSRQKGKSILHFAVESGSLRTVIYVVEILGLQRLINQPDMDGNTPFHLAAKLTSSRTFFYFVFDSMQDQKAVNKDQQTAFHIHDSQRLKSVYSAMSNMWVKFLRLPNWAEWLKELGNEDEGQGSQLINSYQSMASTLGTIATLITTVTFAAALQVPGGFSNQGVAALQEDPFFTDFLIIDVIALTLSLTSVFLILFGTYFENKVFIVFMEIARVLTILSFLATGLAFNSGVSVILSPGSDLQFLIFGVAQWCPYLLAIIGFPVFVFPVMMPHVLYVYQSTPLWLRRWVFSSKYTQYIIFGLW